MISTATVESTGESALGTRDWILDPADFSGVASNASCPRSKAPMMQAPTTVVLIAFPAKSFRFSSDSFVRIRFSAGIPCKSKSSSPTRGPPLLVT